MNSTRTRCDTAAGDGGSTRGLHTLAAPRDAMGEACLLELDELGTRLTDAGLRLSDFRLLVSFSS